MPRVPNKIRDAARLRQLQFRERKKRSGMIEVRAIIPAALAADLQVAAFFTPAGTKDSIIGTALEVYLAKHSPDARKMSQAIAMYWERIMTYRVYSPSLTRPGQKIMVKGRHYTYEESTKLAEIRATILEFFKVRGVKDPQAAAFAVYSAGLYRK